MSICAFLVPRRIAFAVASVLRRVTWVCKFVRGSIGASSYLHSRCVSIIALPGSSANSRFLELSRMVSTHSRYSAVAPDGDSDLSESEGRIFVDHPESSARPSQPEDPMLGADGDVADAGLH